MLARLEGTLLALDHGAALVRTDGGLSYEVLLPAFTAQRLAAAVDQPVVLHTVQFLESQNQGATFIPRLAGFLTENDKAFYELFVTAKGIGYRRALRAMTLSSARIAAAIADRDIATLQSLPEIGKRTAENLTVNLRDKAEQFAGAGAAGATSGAAGGNDSAAQRADGVAAGSGETAPAEAPTPRNNLAKEAVEAMVQLGENRAEAMRWVDHILTQHDDPPTTAEGVLTEVYRLKASAG
jgi:Holliday junction DNA helicase RuvA